MRFSGKIDDGISALNNIGSFFRIADIAAHGYVLTPGRYVGLTDDEDDFIFAERFNTLKAEFEAQLVEEEKFNRAIAENLVRVKL